MYRFVLLLISTGLLFHTAQAQLFPQLGAQRAGISALTFLKIDVSPRSSGMGGANVAMNGDAYSTFWNPAALSDLEGVSIAGSNTFWVAGINHAFGSVSKPMKAAGTFALSAQSLTTGAMERRTEYQPDGTGEYFYASNTAIGLTWSKQLADFFSWGVTAKFVNEKLAEYSANTAVIDLGFMYKTDVKDLKFSVMMQSFGLNSRLKGTYKPDPNDTSEVKLNSYPAPTVFALGASMIPFKRDNQSLTVALQLNHPNDNSENIRIGVEYEYRKLLFARVGYKLNVKDFDYPTAGIGLRMRMGKHPLNLDYSVDPTRYLGWIHRVGLSIQFNPMNREENSSAGESAAKVKERKPAKPEKVKQPKEQ